MGRCAKNPLFHAAIQFVKITADFHGIGISECISQVFAMGRAKAGM